MEKAFGKEIRAQQLVDLGRYEIAVRLSENGDSRFPFKGKTIPPVEGRGGSAEKLIARSRERFATARNVVEQKLHRWLGSRLSDFDSSRRTPKNHPHRKSF